jgi:exodeoxyribonuclease VII small subunit
MRNSFMASGKKNNTTPTFEQSLRKLEQIVEQLEHGDVPLEESIRMYEEGLALSKLCVERLADVELKVKKLSKDMEGHFHLADAEPE